MDPGREQSSDSDENHTNNSPSGSGGHMQHPNPRNQPSPGGAMVIILYRDEGRGICPILSFSLRVCVS